MHQFHRYDPAQPRTVTSFKGNQKLIFEGYRYNIHHIVPAKGVKTWRCVCAKKLNGSRSWCKGRAETWEGDSQGVSKGEHNHPAEHEVAELEFFRSQLILAAISDPQANLNELIDEAIALMSNGVSFGSRESLKKSLTGARKQAENGGFKMKLYKSADKPIKNLAYNKLIRQQPLNTGTEQKQRDAADNGTKSGAGVLQLLALGKSGNERTLKQTPAARVNSSLASNCSPSLLDSSGFHSASSLCSAFSSPSNNTEMTPNSTLLMTMVAAAAAAAAFGNGNKIDAKCPKKEEEVKTVTMNQQNAQIIQRKKARVNSIFNRLSTKAATAAAAFTCCSSSASDVLATNSSGHSLPSTDVEANKEDPKNHEKPGVVVQKAFAAAGTQTDQETQIGISDKLSSSMTSDGDECKCRVVRVCCCNDRAKCTGGRKRKWQGQAEEEREAQDEALLEGRERSAPPSSCSSVENQPHHLSTEKEHHHAVVKQLA